MPGRTAAPVTASTSAAALPATRMRSITSALCTGSSGRRTGVPDSAYGGRAISGGDGASRAQPTGADVGVGRLVAALELLAAPAPARVVGLEHAVAAGGEIGHEQRGYRCHHGSVLALEPLPAVRVEAIELVTVSLRLAVPLTTAAGRRDQRDVLLVHVRAAEADGWAECVAEPEPTYSAEFTAAAAIVLRDHLLPRAWSGPTGDALALGPHLDAVRGQPDGARGPGAGGAGRTAARRRPLAGLLARRHRPPSSHPAPRSGLHDDVEHLLTEADDALARRRRPAAREDRPGPGRRSPRRAAGPRRRTTSCSRPTPTARFTEDDPELDAPRRPSGSRASSSRWRPTDLLGHARLADRLATPICLDEPLTSLGAIEAAIALGACEVVCLKPARVGGWIAARAVHDRCAELGVPALGGRDARDRDRARRQPGRRRAAERHAAA